MSRSSPPPPRRRSIAASAPAGSSPKRLGLSREAWLLLLLLVPLVLVIVAVPLYYGYRLLRAGAARAEGESQTAVAPSRLGQLPTVAEYPQVDELRREADAISETLLKRYPTSPAAFHIAATQAVQRHQYKRAVQLWRRAIELAPEFPGPRAGLAMAHLEQGHERRAVAILQQVLDAGPATAEVYQLLTRALQRTGDFARAEPVCREGLQRYPDHAVLWLELGQLQLQLQKLADARESLQRVVQLQPNATSAYFSLARVAARFGDAEQAQQHKARYQELKEQNPLRTLRFQVIYRASLQRIVAGSLVRAAEEHRRQGDESAAEKCLLRALELRPEDTAACQALVALYRHQRRITDAYRVQQRLLVVQPKSQHRVNLASLAVALRRYEEAESALMTALDSDPHSSVARRSLVLLYRHTGRFAEARSQAEQLARRDPSTEHYELLGQVCLEQGDQGAYQAALQQARRGRDP